MFSHFGNRARGMAFTTSPETFARHDAFRHAETVLSDYLAGREKLYAVRDALRELRALFHDGAALPVALIEQAAALPSDDEETRLQLVTEALDLIGRQVRADARLRK